MKGYLAVSELDKEKYFKEEYKSEVINDNIKFPKELGVVHPFEFEDAEKVFRTIGVVAAFCNKYVDNLTGEFSIKSKNPNAKKLIDDFIKNSNFEVTLSQWILEAVIKGNGFLELDIKNQKCRVINANHLYVVRDKKGNIKGYNQFLGKSLKNFSLDSRNVISFLPDEIAHLTINKIAGDAYGQGVIMPNERIIENMVLIEEDIKKLLSRKAGAPIHVKVGQPGEITDPSAVDNIKNLLVYMTNRTEWVTDGNVEMNVLNFGEIGKSLMEAWQSNFRTLCAGVEIPEVMMNSGQLNEGIAKVQLEGLQRKMASIQEDIEVLVENQIFKPLLKGIQDMEVEFIWNLPSEEEINNRLIQLNTLLQNQYLTDGMRKEIQIEMARLLNFNNPEELATTPNSQGMTADKNPVFQPDGKVFEPKKDDSSEKKNEERKKEDKIPQPEVPGAKKEATEILPVELPKELPKCEHISEADTFESTEKMSVKEFVNLVEISGFNYSDYLVNILRRLKTDKFEELKALTEKDIQDGLLDPEQITKLKVILKDAFRKNKSIADIRTEIKDTLRLTDRIAENGSTIPAESRPDLIARTETIRLANLGLVDTYKQNGINKVRWLAALSDRTCEICEGLNGQIFEIDKTPMPTVDSHVNCRCSLLSVLE